MEKILKKCILVVALIAFNITVLPSHATETVSLQLDEEVAVLKAPISTSEILTAVNDDKEPTVEDNISALGICDSEIESAGKFEKTFYKFVNDRVVNKQLNIFSSSIGKE